MNIILYTINCPQCRAIKQLLDDNKIEYSICKDEKVFAEKNIDRFPVVEVDGQLLSGKAIFNFVQGAK